MNVLHVFSYANLPEILALASIITYENDLPVLVSFSQCGVSRIFFSEHNTGDHSSFFSVLSLEQRSTNNARTASSQVESLWPFILALVKGHGLFLWHCLASHVSGHVQSGLAH